ncbi:MAG: glycoside hydrolase family 3 C-terminal domain-containing protein [Parasporobacterium sp.]|nr:glycoside hydrolase family 3 C-terminal domain-containing protein [Parasporobacterium sp.]
MKRKIKKAKWISLLTVSAVGTALAGGTVMSAAAADVITDSQDAVWGDGTLDASAAVNQKLAEESIILLKNKDAALPLAANENGKTMISVFGRDASDFYYAGGGSGTGEDSWKSYKRDYTYISVYDGLEAADFEVNTELKALYENYNAEAGNSYGNGTSAPNEMPVSNFADFTITDEAKAGAAIIVLGRTGSEGGDLDTGSYELNEDGTYTEIQKHALKLSDDEEALIDYVTEQGFSKVIVVLNIPMAFECGTLESNDKIDSVLWIGHPGVNGNYALGEVLNGSVNPSGRLADIYANDFTKDPTFGNIEDNTHIVSGDKTGTFTYFYDDGNGTEGSWSAVEYEEGIYYGYRYYETRSNTEDAAWYDDNVVYPFGYGLSYTSFSWDDMTVTESGADEDGYSDVCYEISLTVTNTGDAAGKDVVELYYTAPYTDGGIEKSYVELADFAKTDLLAPGESQTVTLTVYKQDMASFDYNDANANGHTGYELDGGSYELKLQTDSHNVKTDSNGEALMAVVDLEAVNFDKDRVTHETVEALFSSVDGYNSLGGITSSEENGAAGDMTQLSRSDWEGTWPSTPIYSEVKETTVSNFMGTMVMEKAGIDIGTEKSAAIVSAKSLNTEDGAVGSTEHESDTAWYGYYSDIIAKYITEGITGSDGSSVVKWTQAEDDSAEAAIRYESLVGVDFDDPLWEEFMNQMTWEEIADYVNVSIYQNKGFERLGIWSTDHADGPVCMHHQYDASKHGWQYVATTNVAATWSKELANEEGLSIADEALSFDEQGWYAPGLNLHRDPFGGRNFEYYSEDGILAGKIAAEVCKGLQSKGVNCFIKHFAVNNQETDRGGLITYLNEQNLRQNYLKAFQLCIEDGGALAMMVSMNCIGNVSTYNNYQLTNRVLRQEWGFLGEITTDIISAPTAGALDTEATMYRRCGISNGLLLGDMSCTSVWDAAENGVFVNGERNDIEWASIRMAVKYALYANVNTNEKDHPTYDNEAGFNAPNGDDGDSAGGESGSGDSGSEEAEGSGDSDSGESDDAEAAGESNGESADGESEG